MHLTANFVNKIRQEIEILKYDYFHSSFDLALIMMLWRTVVSVDNYDCVINHWDLGIQFCSAGSNWNLVANVAPIISGKKNRKWQLTLEYSDSPFIIIIITWFNHFTLHINIYICLDSLKLIHRIFTAFFIDILQPSTSPYHYYDIIYLFFSKETWRIGVRQNPVWVASSSFFWKTGLSTDASYKW